MTKKTESNTPSLITPEQIFIAYAEMRANRDSYPKTKAYYFKRWRLICALFEIRIVEDTLEPIPESELLKGLAFQWWDAAYFSPLSTPYIGRHEEPDRSIAAAHHDSLARKAASMRSEYRQMGGELIRERFPEAQEKRVAISRLHELGLPLKAPNATQECIEYMEAHWDDEEEMTEPSGPDNVSEERMDELKLAEEVRARAKAAPPVDVAAVRELALEQGIAAVREQALQQGMASEEEIDRVIYEMNLAEFLKLSSDHPNVSRIHFKPALKKQP